MYVLRRTIAFLSAKRPIVNAYGRRVQIVSRISRKRFFRFPTRRGYETELPRARTRLQVPGNGWRTRRPGVSSGLLFRCPFVDEFAVRDRTAYADRFLDDFSFRRVRSFRSGR